MLRTILLAFLGSWAVFGQNYLISTIAGPGLPVNVPGPSASLSGLQFVAVDGPGNVYFSDYDAILRLDAATGLLSVVVSNANADGLAHGVAVDSTGAVYTGDGQSEVWKVSDGVVTIVAGGLADGFGGDGGPATSAQLYLPSGVALDGEGNLYISDLGNQRIRKISNGIITTVAGNGTAGFSGDGGPATSAALNTPEGITVDSAGNLYIADIGNGRVRKVSNGIISTVAGNGDAGSLADGAPAVSASLFPFGVAVDSAGNLYIGDDRTYRIRKVSNGTITTVAGNGTQGFSGDGALATKAELSEPFGVAVSASGDLYFADSGIFGSGNNRIRKVSNGVITSVAGGIPVNASGPAAASPLQQPSGVSVDSAGNVYVADTDNNIIRKVSNGEVTTVAGNGTGGFSGDNGPATSAQLNNPYGVAVDSAGNLYVSEGSGHVRRISNGTITTVAGARGYYSGGFSGDGGPATSAEFDGNFGIAVDPAGNIYIADANNNRIRKVSNGIITTAAGNGTGGFSGDGGPATSAELNGPLGVAVDTAGNLYIADTYNFRIRKVSNGVITTAVGPFEYQSFTSMASPAGVAVDAGGNLYIAATTYGVFAKDLIVRVSNGIATVIAGNGYRGFSGDGGLAVNAMLDEPGAVAADTVGDVYIADTGNNRIRLLKPVVLTAQMIAFRPLTGMSLGGLPFTITATASSGLAVTFASTIPAVCTVAGATVTLVATGTCSITASQPGNTAFLAAVSVTQSFAVTAAAIAPVILGIENNANGAVTGVPAGSLISIFGSQLATSAAQSPTIPLSSALAGSSVTINGIPAPLYSAIPGTPGSIPSQINAQVPFNVLAAGLSGTVNVVVTNNGFSSLPFPLTINQFAPAVYSIAGLGSGYSVAFFGLPSDPRFGHFVAPPGTFSGVTTYSANPGDVLTIYATGLGAVSPALTNGVSPDPNNPSLTVLNPTVLIGGVQATFFGAALTQFPGVYQLNIGVPQGGMAGNSVPLQIQIGGITSSNSTVIAVTSQ